MAAEIPAGWYPNPWNDAEELYWSGLDWTGISRTAHRRNATIPASEPAMASEVEDSTVMRPVGAPAVRGQEDVRPRTNGAPPPFESVAFDSEAAPAPSAFSAPTPDAGSVFAAPYSMTPEAEVAYAQPYEAPPRQENPPSAGVQPPNGEPAYAAHEYHDPRYATPDAASIRWALGGEQPPPAQTSRARLGLVSMILGIAAAVFAIIPGLSFAAWIPAFVAVGLGIVAYLGPRPRTFALTGIITAGAALAVGTAVSIWFLAQLGALVR